MREGTLADSLCPNLLRERVSFTNSEWHRPQLAETKLSRLHSYSQCLDRITNATVTIFCGC